MLLPPPTPMIASGRNCRAASAEESMVFRSTSGRPSGKTKTSAPPSFSSDSTRSAIPLLTMFLSVQIMTRLPSSLVTFFSSSRTPQPKKTRPAVEKPQWRLLADCGPELCCCMPDLLRMRNSFYETFFAKLILGISRGDHLREALAGPRRPQFIQIALHAGGKCFSARKCLRVHHDEQIADGAPIFGVERSQHLSSNLSTGKQPG